MRNYKPSFPFNVYMQLLIPTETLVKGVSRKTFSGEIYFYGSFRTFGGSETNVNDLYTVVDTAIIDTWFRPEIKADCKIKIVETGETYDIISDPENINMRNQYMQFRVKKMGA